MTSSSCPTAITTVSTLGKAAPLSSVLSSFWNKHHMLIKYLSYVQNLSPIAKSNLSFNDPKTRQNFYLPGVVNPFDSPKKGVFVERNFWCCHAFLMEESSTNVRTHEDSKWRESNPTPWRHITATNQSRAYTLFLEVNRWSSLWCALIPAG